MVGFEKSRRHIFEIQIFEGKTWPFEIVVLFSFRQILD